MNFKFAGLTILGFLGVACVQSPPAPNVNPPPTPSTNSSKLFGTAQITLGPDAQIRVQSRLGNIAASFNRTQYGTFDDVASQTRYMWATFQVTNNSSAAFSNLTLVAYDQHASNFAGTSFKQITNFGGNAITSVGIAQGIKPTHRMEQVGTSVAVRNADADLQGMGGSEINNLQGEALSQGLLLPADQLLEYGFVAQTDTGRSIPAGGTGRVTLAVKLPISSDINLNPFRFTMTALLADMTVTRVTRGDNETTANAISRAPSGTTELALIGTDDTVTGYTKIYLPNIKTAFDPSLEPSRDPWLAPFHRASIWNLPLGQNAQITDIGAFTAPLNGFGSDTELHFKLSASDPLRPLYDPGAFGPGRCTGTTQQGGGFSFHLPDDLVVADATPSSTPNAVSAFLQPDGLNVFEIEPFARCTPGGSAYGYRNSQHPSANITTDGGAYGTHFGSGLSGYGGSLRYNELTTPVSQPITHALHFNVWGRKFLYSNAADPTPGYRFPADRADSGSDSSLCGDPNASNVYCGTNPHIEIGALLAIPPTVTAASLGITSPAAIKIFEALKNYGAYITDNTGWDHYDFGVSEDAEHQFQEVNGYTFYQGSSATGAAKTWYDDVVKIITALGVVNDSAADNIGGAGVRRAPLAPYRFTASDSSPPSIPSALTEVSTTPASVNLSWTASTDNVGIMRYEILNGSSVVARTWGATSVTVAGLSPSTTYNLTVRAMDTNQNVSAVSSALATITKPGYVVDFSTPPIGWSYSTVQAIGQYCNATTPSVSGGILNVGCWNYSNQFALYDARVTTGSYSLDADLNCGGTSIGNTTDFFFNTQDASNTYTVHSFGGSTGSGGTPSLELQKLVNGTVTVLATASGGNVQNGNSHYRLEFNASTGAIVVKLNGSTVLTASDTTYAGGGFGFGSSSCKTSADNLVLDGTLEYPRFFSSNFDSGAPGWTLSAGSSAGTANDYGRLTTGNYGVFDSSLHDAPINQSYTYLFDWFTYGNGQYNVIRALFNATDATHGYALEISGTGVTRLLKLDGATTTELATYASGYNIVGDVNKARVRIVYNASNERIIIQAERGGSFTDLFDLTDTSYTGSKVGFSSGFSQSLSDNVVVKPGLDVLITGGFSSNFDSPTAPGWTLSTGSVVQYGRLDVGNFGALQTAFHTKDTSGKYDFSFDVFTYASDELYNYIYAYFDYTDADNTYVLEITAGVNNHLRLLKRVAGVETVLANYDPSHYSVSYSLATPRFTINRNGSSITISAVRGATTTSLFNLTDSSLSGSSVGFGSLYSVANLDNVAVVPQP